MPGWAFRFGALAALGALAMRFQRVTVTGDSMQPTLEPGDRLLVWRTRRVEPGRLVVVADPRLPDRALVKRVSRVGADGTVEVRGDNPQASTDSRVFGAVGRAQITGRAVYRYHPTERARRL